MTSISIITRTYRGRRALLERAARSVFAQSTQRPIEWIIVEDGGCDSAPWASSLRGVPANITVRHIGIEKGGRSATANAGLEAAHGDYIGFLDDDDELYADHCETLATLLDDDSRVAGAYAAAHEVQADRGGQQHADDAGTERVFLVPALASYVLIWQNLFPIQSVLFRRSYLSNHRFDINLDALEDWLFWLQMFLEKELVWTPRVTSRYYVPSDPAAYAVRLDHHRRATPYFNLQREALLAERGMESWQNLHDHYVSRVGKVLSKSNGVGTNGYNEGAADAGVHLARATSRLHQALELDAVPDVTARGSRTVVFTSINLRYLPKALVLGETLKQVHPEWDYHILLNDALCEQHPVLANVDVIFPIRGCGIENFHGWCFGHDVVELCTATKAFYVRQLFEAGVENVIFLDPDIAVLGELAPLLDRLRQSSMLLTPHSFRPARRDSEIFYTEMSLLAHGVFNLGFFAVHNNQQGRQIIDFLCRRMQGYCHDDHARGLFTDQKWFNLVPVLFEGVEILREDGYNVASWNVSNRAIRKVDGRLHAGSDLLRFFHFSGYDSSVPRRMFEIFGQYNSALEELLDWYKTRIGHYEQAAKPLVRDWAFGQFDNMVPIRKGVRRFWRRALEHRLIYEKPFYVGADPSFFRYAAAHGFDEIDRRYASPTTLERYF